MVKVNLLPPKPVPAIFRKGEKALWIIWFSLPFALILWAKA
jgi:hypothetical protein